MESVMQDLFKAFASAGLFLPNEEYASHLREKIKLEFDYKSYNITYNNSKIMANTTFQQHKNNF